MNERIKQLLGQAYDEAVPETWTTLSSEQLGRVYDKFAELIVKDITSQLMSMQNFEWQQNYQGGWHDAALAVEQLYKD